MKSVVITGASTGLGKAFAVKCALEGWRVFAGVRKEADGDDLKNAHSAITPLILDVTSSDDLKHGSDLVAEALDGRKLSGLVNNAGIAKLAPLPLQDIEEFRSHFDVNVFGALAATQAFLPLLGMDTTLKGAPGRIINITSVGGELASPFLGAYTASKHALESVTDSLRRELLVYGIDAIAVGPGAVKTPIWQKAKDDDAAAAFKETAWAKPIKKFLDTMIAGGNSGLEPDDVADVVFEALSADKPSARYAPVPNKFFNYTLPTNLPKRLVDKGFARKFGL